MEKKSFLEENLKPLVIGLLLIIITVTVLLIISISYGGQSVRYLKIAEISGSASICRDGAVMHANKNMMIKSGDVISTDENAKIRLETDGNKFITVEPSSSLYVQYTPTTDRGEICVNLTKGSIINNISSLSKNAVYTVKTPNTSVDVKGTVFRVSFDLKSNFMGHSDVMVTDVNDFEGTVGISLFDCNGDLVDKEMLLVEKKGARMITCSDVSQYIYLNQDFDIYDMSTNTLSELIRASNGRELPYSGAELNSAYLKKANEEQKEQTETSANTDDSDLQITQPIEIDNITEGTTVPDSDNNVVTSFTDPTTVIYNVTTDPRDEVDINDIYSTGAGTTSVIVPDDDVQYTMPTGAPWWEMTETTN